MAKKLTQEYLLKVVASGLKEVTKEIQTLNNNLTGVDKSAEKTGKAFENVKKKQDPYIRGLKAAGGGTNNQSKAFSKMAQNMNGTLVPAYATVAANVFALTAAFGALSRAADLQILIDASKQLAVQTGRSLIGLSNSMKDITNNAINMKDALQSASIAASAGFDNSTIEQLTQVARNASVALGRDMTDSLNRVFKGAIKAEPELLDELGIILRLDTASRNYAATLGKTVQSLTTFEKQQGVVNAVLEQGVDKFGEFADVDVNPYTQLASSFTDVSAALIALINIPITPVFKYFAENTTALTVALLLFANTVLKKAFPALGNFAEVMQTKLASSMLTAASAAKKATETQISFRRSLQGTDTASQKTLTNFSKGIFQVQDVVQKTGVKISKNFKTAFKLGTDTVGGLTAYKKGIQGILRAFARGTQVSQGFKNNTKNVKFLNEELGESSTVLEGIKKKTISTQTRFQAFGSTITSTFAKGKLAAISFGAAVTSTLTSGALAGYANGFAGVRDEIRWTAETSTGLSRVFKILGVSIAGLGGAFLKVLPFIGQVVIAWQILSSIFGVIKDAIFDKELINLTDTLADNTEALDTASKSAAFFNKRLKDLPDTLDNIHKKATLASNTFATLASNLEKTLKDIDISEGFGGFDSFLDAFGFGDLDEFKDQLDQTNKVLKDFGYTEEALSIQKQFNNLLRLSGDEATIAAEKLLKYVKVARDAQRGTLELNTLIKDTLKGLSKSLTKLGGELPAISALEQGLLELGTILKTLDSGNVNQVISAIENLNTLDLQQLGLKDVATDIANIQAPLKDLNKDLQKVEDDIEKITETRKRASEVGGFFKIATLKETSIELQELLDLQKFYKEDIDLVSESLQKQADIIIPALKKAEVRFKAVAAAQNVLINQRQELAGAGLEQGLNAAQRLDLIKQMTDAENNYLKTISKQTKVLEFDVDKALKTIEKELIKLRKVPEKDQDKGKIANLERQHLADTIIQLRIRNKLKEDDAKIVTNSIKLLKSSQKELTKISFLTHAGLQGYEDQEEFIRNNLITTLTQVAPALKEADETAKDFVARLLTASDSANKLANIQKEFKIGDPAALAAELVALEAKDILLTQEAEYLRDNNVLLSERIDKEYILRDLALERQQDALQSGITDDGVNTAAELAALQQIADIEKVRTQNKITQDKAVAVASKKVLKGIRDEIKLAQKINALGINASKVKIDAIKLEEKIQKLKLKGHEKEAKALKEELNLLKDLDFANAFNAEIASITDGLSDFTGIIKDLKKQTDTIGVDKLTAGLNGLRNIAIKSGDGVSEAFAGVGLELKRVGDLQRDGKGETIQWGEVTSTVAGAMGKAFKEGSDGAKAMMLIQQGVALTAAVSAIASAGTGDPYTSPARIAAMISIMSSVLSIAGIAFGGASVGGDGGEQAYKDSISKQGLVGQRDLQSNSLIDAIEDLVSIDTELFSTNRELQLSLINLNKTFSKIGGALFGAGGQFEATNILDLFGISFGSTGGGNILSSRSTSNKLVDAGIELSATIDLVGGTITSSLDEATFFLVESITRTKKSLFGGTEISTRLKISTEDIGDALDKQLQIAVGRIGTVVAELFSTFTQILDLNLSKLFGGLGSLIFDNIKISLTGKDAEEQSESIAAFVSLLSNSLVERLVPALSQFSLAGEELLDTLIRITESIIQLQASFSTLGVSIADYFDTSSLTTLDPDDIYEQAFGGDKIDTTYLENLGVRFDEVISFLDYTNARSSGFISIPPVERFRTELLEPQVIKDNIEAAIEAMKITLVAAWEEAFLANFKDFDEFSSIFEKFSETLYSESELAKIALENAENTVNSGFSLLRSSLEELGDQDLINLLEGNTEEALRAIYEMGNEIGAFATRFDESTGEIDTSGADLLALIMQLGAALGYQQDAVEDLIDVLDNLNQQYERQIATFGLLGKELDLLQLSFEFEDALIEAAKTGTDIALVETYYGLQRLDIIREYNQEIVDLIDEGMSNVSDSMLSVLQSAAGWNEVAYQSIRITKIVDKLSASFNNLGIDFSVFSDLDDTTDFLTTLESFINVTVGSGDSISDQILLVEELRTAVAARYEAEVAASEDLENSINDSIAALRDLSMEIGNFLDDLFVGDLSPLTNAQKLAEAQTQFDENLQNVLSQDTALAESARSDLLQSASTLLELANLFFAIGPEYQAIFNNVVGSLESIDQSILDDIGLSEEALAIQSLESSLTDLQLRTLTQLQTLDSILLELSDQNTINLNNELSVYAPQIINSLDTITSKIEQINNESWNPILQQLLSLNSTMSNFVNNINSFAKGSEEISFDQVAMIHKGETILTADTSKSIRDGDSIYGTSDAVFSNTGGNNSDVVDAIRILTQVVASGNEDMLDKNEEIRQATRLVSSDINISRPASAKGII